jgi:hypothetical protein
MRNFTDEVVDLIIENEIPRIDKIMNEVTKNISIDFAKETFRLLDEYYDNYTPIRYVRVYGNKRKLRTKKGTTSRKPRAGQVSLHAAITRIEDDGPAIGVHGGSYYDGYIGGVVFDSSKFQGNGMRHIGKGISEWNIVENFLYAGDAGEHNLKGDWRSVSAADYHNHSADEAMNIYMDFYGSTFDMHYKNALKKFS